MKNIAVLTSGGDAPGMNAAIRSVVRNGMYHELEVYGIEKGYTGLIEDKFRKLEHKEVGGIMQSGGTILQTSRCEEFLTDQGQHKAIENLQKRDIKGLVVIGGNGSLKGALELHKKGINTIGIPGTIDNDLAGTDMAIGVDTALNTIIDAVDKIKDTATSHERAFIIEVMGRESGYLALMASIATGAEQVFIPEREVNIEKTARKIREGHKRGKKHGIIILAEGAGNAYTIGRDLKNILGYEIRITILGHLQRGGSPSAFDRILASKMGAKAVEALANGKSGKMASLRKNSSKLIPIEEAVKTKIEDRENLYELNKILSL
ncbi:MAG: 6-phosphofructokinase [Candidatus Mcinerneyibacterium aminivorans]|uniref:ATP-dependent 6-phosphofructokinase n=1 Tax=Candidatus Mcinerneyibacterium aminivorans TaxID=2703815 RepID=A0A5D0MJ53_9BACT|nr:MAG: 6-phosphofructokinase [Candidatus Mcinerneyibacterium aminivorans]